MLNVTCGNNDCVHLKLPDLFLLPEVTDHWRWEVTNKFWSTGAKVDYFLFCATLYMLFTLYFSLNHMYIVSLSVTKGCFRVEILYYGAFSQQTFWLVIVAKAKVLLVTLMVTLLQSCQHEQYQDLETKAATLNSASLI